MSEDWDREKDRNDDGFEHLGVCKKVLSECE